MKITEDVADVLANSTIEETKLFLPNYQLDRKLYTAVNKVLTAIKGKWNRTAKAHLFPECPIDIIEEILQTGEYANEKKEFQFFETPSDLAEWLVGMAGPHNSGESRLEPQAGRGRIAKYMPDCDCIELNPDNKGWLINNGFNVVGEDFLEFDKKYDVIVANPPFTRQQDIDHINHMLDLFQRCVVSVASASVLYRSNKKTIDFRDRVYDLGGTIEPLPEKSFISSGTNVNTCVVRVEK